MHKQELSADQRVTLSAAYDLVQAINRLREEIEALRKELGPRSQLMAAELGSIRSTLTTMSSRM